MISQEALNNFKQIWKEEFNEEITNEKAMEVAIKILVLFDHIYRPIKKEWLDEIETKSKK